MWKNGCSKNKKIKFSKLYPRKSTAKFVHKEKLERKINTMKRQLEERKNKNKFEKRKRQCRYSITQIKKDKKNKKKNLGKKKR